MANYRNTGLHDTMSWQRLLDEWYGSTKFDVVVRRLTDKMNEQLKDSFAIQKVYDGTASSSVWEGRNRWHYKRKRDTTSGRDIIHNWHEESEWRKAHDDTGKQWYSTGRSRQITEIEIENNDLAKGVFTMNTTFGLLMAEMGLGLNGKLAVRGKGGGGRKRIKVQRDAPYAAKKRYVPNWVPGQGHAHRPTAKRQFAMYARAIRNFAADMYGYKISSWLIYGFAEAVIGCAKTEPITMDFDVNNNIRLTINGEDFAQLPEPKH